MSLLRTSARNQLQLLLHQHSSLLSPVMYSASCIFIQNSARPPMLLDGDSNLSVSRCNLYDDIIDIYCYSQVVSITLCLLSCRPFTTWGEAVLLTHPHYKRICQQALWCNPQCSPSI